MEGSTIEPYRSSQMESRWHRPNLYITIVGLYLLIFSGILVSNIPLELHYILSENRPDFMEQYYQHVYTYLSIAIPLLVGSIFLLKRKKFAIIISTISLLLLIGFLSMSALSWEPFSSPTDILRYIELFSAPAMLVLLLIGWSHVQRNQGMAVTMKSSRWKRPNIYITVASLYLLIISIIAFAWSGYGYDRYVKSMEECEKNISCSGDPRRAMAPLFVMLFIIPAVFIGFISAIGGSLLMLRYKAGIFFSLGALILLTAISAWLTIGWSIAPSGNSPYGPAMILVPTSIMYPLLILGWKRVQWR